MARPSPSFLPATCFVSKLFFACIPSRLREKTRSHPIHPPPPFYEIDVGGGRQNEPQGFGLLCALMSVIYL